VLLPTDRLTPRLCVVMTAFDTDGEPLVSCAEAQHPCAARNDLRRPTYLEADDLLGQMKVIRARRGIREPDGGSAAPARLGSDCQPAALALEQTLGAPLLLRTTRRCTSPDAGSSTTSDASALVREIDDASSRCGPTDGPGFLTVSAPVTLGLARVCPHVPRFSPSTPAAHRPPPRGIASVDIVSARRHRHPQRHRPAGQRLAHRATANDLRASLVASPALPGSARRARGPRKLWQVTICCSTSARRESRRMASFSGGPRGEGRGLTSFRTMRCSH